MFNTAQYCIQALADLLKQNVDNLLANAPYWQDIVPDAQVSAYNEIVSHLVNRGFTIDQINAWDRGAEFELSLMKFWALVNGGAAQSYDDKFIKALDRRKDLDTVAVFVGGVFVSPGQTQAGTINFGQRQGFPRTWPGSADSDLRHGHGGWEW